MSDKKKKIEDGQNFEVVDGITIINDVSVAEKDETLDKKEVKTEEAAKEESNDLASEIKPDVEIPKALTDENNKALEVQAEEESSPQIDLSSILPTEPTANPSESQDLAINAPIDPNPVIDPSLGNNFSNPMTGSVATSYNEIPNPSLYTANATDYNPLFGRENSGFTAAPDNRVFKVPSDVDSSIEKFMGDVKKSYDENIANPTKTLVEFVNAFVKWGNQVTAKGLNRELFDEYDKLMEDLNNTKSYDGLSTSNSYSNASLNNYNDDYKNDGGMGMAA